jgi:predicted permease
MPESLEPVMKGASWTLSALGMIIIGVTLTTVDIKKVNYGQFSKLMAVRYIAAALILGALVWLESVLIGQLQSDDQKLMLLMASFPIAANLVVFATFIDAETEDASILVTFSSIISLVLVPVACLLLFGQ